MTEKDKIVEIILNTDVTERAAARIADDLIENDIGDVSEWKRKTEIAQKAGEIIQRDILRVFGSENPVINDKINALWDLALQQAEREIEENALLTVEEEQE